MPLPSAPAILPFDPFAPGAASTAALFAMRVTGLVLVAPVFSARTIPVRVRTGLLVLLTLLLAPVALHQLAGPPRLTPAAVLGEGLVGFALGFGAALIVGAAEAAGDLMSVQIGLSGAAILDPLNNTQVGVLGSFTQLFAVTLLLSVDAHLVMLDALAESARVAPVGAALDLAAGAGAMARSAGLLFALGLKFAAPVVAATMIANVALAVLSRAAPQLNILSLAFPVQIGVGLFALAASLGLVAAFFLGWGASYDAVLTSVFGAFGAPVR